MECYDLLVQQAVRNRVEALGETRLLFDSASAILSLHKLLVIHGLCLVTLPLTVN